MDRQKVVSPDKFERLAEAMLCLCMHNCKSRPLLNQVDEVCEEWQVIFEEYVKRIKRKQRITRNPPKFKSTLDDLQAAKALDTEIETKIGVCSLQSAHT